jgi:hypothetical protein
MSSEIYELCIVSQKMGRLMRNEILTYTGSTVHVAIVGSALFLASGFMLPKIIMFRYCRGIESSICAQSDGG